MDRLTVEQRRKNMQAVKSCGSKIEVALAKGLFARGFRYRKNNRNVFGRPDITISKYKIAIFVDSEFWHGKNWENKKSDFQTNTQFWHSKIQKNMERDIIVNQTLADQDWLVIRIWGNEIIKDLEICLNKIEFQIKKRINQF